MAAPIDTAEAVKRESESLLYYLFVKKQDLVVSTMALHCVYVSLVCPSLEGECASRHAQTIAGDIARKRW
ncbi:MAG: hypothetical protein WCC17_16615 [Candidatus Nitrosopolaris sp.]